MPHSIFFVSSPNTPIPGCQQTHQETPLSGGFGLRFILAWEREEKLGKEEGLRENPSGWQWGMTRLIHSGKSGPSGLSSRGRQTGRDPVKYHFKGEMRPGWRSAHQPPSGGSESGSPVSSSSPEKGGKWPQVDSTQQILSKDSYGMQIFRNPVVV